jgi:hypothetical protein
MGLIPPASTKFPAATKPFFTKALLENSSLSFFMLQHPFLVQVSKWRPTANHWGVRAVFIFSSEKALFRIAPPPASLPWFAASKRV